VAWGRSRWSDQPEFVVVTHWDSVAALEAFAGPRWQEAVIKPEEEHMLAQVFCDHYAAPFGGRGGLTAAGRLDKTT
jgi:hypothetical protein